MAFISTSRNGDSITSKSSRISTEQDTSASGTVFVSVQPDIKQCPKLGSVQYYRVAYHIDSSRVAVVVDSSSTLVE